MKNLFDVTGKTILITGGSRGIGEMIARAFVANGAKVTISSRKADACAALAAELGCAGLAFDLSSRAGVDGLAAAFSAREDKLDVLINNAGATWGAPLDAYPEDGWDKVLDTNLKSPFFLTQALLPRLRAAAKADAPARIINIASINGRAAPDVENYAYSASKAGLIMLTRHMARRLAREHILVNAIAPGPFPTKMMAARLKNEGEKIAAQNPLGRWGMAEDIAGVSLFLSSRASAYTTGAVVPCDGGIVDLG